jgi:hypothetical protein
MRLTEEQRLKHNARGRARYRENLEKKLARSRRMKDIIYAFAACVCTIIAAVAAAGWWTAVMEVR